MGSKSKSSSTTTNVSGQNAIQGDNLGVALSGVNGSNINVTMGDYGAIEKSFNFASEALSETGRSHSESLQMVAGLAGNQAAQNSETLSAMMDLAKFKQDGGNSVGSQQLMIAVLGVGAVVAVVAVFGRKK